MSNYGDHTLSIDEQLNIFERCREQGLWVRCISTFNRSFGGDDIVYICPGTIDRNFRSRMTDMPAPRVYGRFVYTDSMDLPVSGFDSKATWFFIGDGTYIAEPVALFTTEELFGLDTDAHIKPFKRIEGKDVWMLASGPNVGWIFVKVLDIQDEYLHADTIKDECVYFDEDSFSEYPPSTMFEEQDIPWSEIQAHQPIEVLTEDELYEMLARADRVYENQPTDWE